MCLALRFSQIVLNVGATTALPAAGFLAVDFLAVDLAVGGGLVGFAFFDLFNCCNSINGTSVKPTVFVSTVIVRVIGCYDEGDLTGTCMIGVQCAGELALRRSSSTQFLLGKFKLGKGS